jgi:hypothetical protein
MTTTNRGAPLPESLAALKKFLARSSFIVIYLWEAYKAIKRLLYAFLLKIIIANPLTSL